MDIVFIKNENDYYEYKKLKPVHYYRNKKVKFICKKCGKESTKNFVNLTLDFICTTCNLHKVMIKEETQNKRKETCRKIYGYDNPMQAQEIKDKLYKTNIERYGSPIFAKTELFIKKSKQTCNEKYGCDWHTQNEEIKNKAKITCKEHYGTEYYFQSNECKEKQKEKFKELYGEEYTNNFQIPEIKEKIKETLKEKYGVEHPMYSEEIKTKMKNTVSLKYGVDNYIKSNEYKTEQYNKWLYNYKIKLAQRNLEFVNRNDTIITLKCKKCNNTFKYSFTGLNGLLQKYQENFCPICSREYKHQTTTSNLEKEFQDYINSITTNYEIYKNNRTILEGKELDVYIPDLKLAFEFDGTYWHADPRFYNENDIIKNNTANEIWKRDKNKDVLCENKNIKLIRIKEYDWLNDNDNIKHYIKEIINEKNK